jgi:hypothetical protein
MALADLDILSVDKYSRQTDSQVAATESVDLAGG